MVGQQPSMICVGKGQNAPHIGLRERGVFCHACEDGQTGALKFIRIVYTVYSRGQLIYTYSGCADITLMHQGRATIHLYRVRANCVEVHDRSLLFTGVKCLFGKFHGG